MQADLHSKIDKEKKLAEEAYPSALNVELLTGRNNRLAREHWDTRENPQKSNK